MNSVPPRPGPPERRRRAGLNGGNGSAGPLPPPVYPPDGGGHVRPLLRRRRASAYRQALRRGPRRRVLRVLLITLAVFCGLGTVAIGVVYAGYNAYKGSLPDPSTVVAMEPAQDSYVYDSTGNLIHVFDADSNDGFRHVRVALANVSHWVKLATIDVEDRHFYAEGSWDIPRLIAAGINDVTHKGGTQGASTITEQLAKTVLEGSNLLGPTSPRSLDYKIKQIVLGNEIAANFSKDEILEMYLNRIYYGNHALGIETAAELYFGKKASDLDLAESSLLSGLPQSPSAYDPTAHDPNVTINPLAKQRQQVVLQAMVSNGDITQSQADSAYAEPLTVHKWTDYEPDDPQYRWFVNYVEGWLGDHFGSAWNTPGGWNIYTTLDSAKQSLALADVHKNVAANRQGENMTDGSLVSMDPKTGEILAMVGAWDPQDDQVGWINMATKRVNPGSTIKLFTYTSAIASGKFTMTTPILDAPYTFKFPGGSYSPLDYDRHWHGTCELKECLGNSFNMPAVKVEAATGIPYINSVEIAAGVSAIAGSCYGKSNTPAPYQYAATLGGLACGISLLDLADGAATIADLGIHHDPMPVTRITVAATGHPVFTYNADSAGRRVIPENVAFIMSEITSNNGNRLREFGPSSNLILPDRRVSAKTGTADYFEDNLTVGWTPDLLTATWVGSPQPSCLQQSDYPRMQQLLRRGYAPDGGVETTVTAPFTAGELRAVHLQPNPSFSHSCGHLTNTVSGISGAAPMWQTFMEQALKGTPKHWYSIPPDVVQTGSGDDQDFFLPSTRNNPFGGSNCYYWGPQPDPLNPCQYTGTGPPPFIGEGIPPPKKSPGPEQGGPGQHGPPTPPAGLTPP